MKYPLLQLEPGQSADGVFRGRGASIGTYPSHMTWLFDPTPIAGSHEGFRLISDQAIRWSSGQWCRVTLATPFQFKLEKIDSHGNVLLESGSAAHE